MKKVLCAILTAATLLLCACGGTAAPEQTPAVTPAPTAAPTPKPTPKPTSSPTPTPKPDRNGFDEASNTELSFGGLTFQIPSYYDEQKFDDDGNGVIGVEESGEIVGGIVFMDVDIDASPSDDEFKSAKDELLNKVAEVVSAKAGTPEETTLCGYTAVKAELHSDKLIGCTILYIVPDSKSISAVLAMYTPDTEYDYIPDFERILESAKINDAVEETSADGVTPEFKAKMDSLEAFFDEYVDFMNTYLNAASSGDVMSMMSKYMNFLNKYTDAMSDLEDIDEVNLSAADYAYYVEVYGRIMQKLLKVVG